MIVVPQDAETNVILTLGELTTLVNPVYLFEFVGNTNVSQFFLAYDLSTAKERYNKFVILEDNDPGSLVIGTTGGLPDKIGVRFRPDGYYNYIVREQTSTVNLDPTLSGGIVERGVMKVTKAVTANKKYDAQSKERKYYSA